MLATPGAAAALGPSPATTDADPVSQALPEEARDAREDARAFADDLQEADPSEAVLRLSEEAGEPATRPDAPDLTAAEALERLAEADGTVLDPVEVRLAEAQLQRLPDGLEAPLAEVLSAVVAAYELRQEAFADLTDEELEFLRTHPRLLNPDGGTGAAVTATGPGLDDPVTVETDRSEADRERVGELGAQVDRTKLAQAEAVLLDAVDATLPALQDVAAGLDAEDPRHAPPTFTLSPFLAVDAGGPTHYHDSYWVSVDLLGDDTYNNNAGGTLVDTDTTSFFAPVALAVDVEGDDEYRYVASSGTVSNGPALAVQGGGLLGVGAIVDAAGADAYEANLTVNPSSNDLPDATFDVVVVAQGAGNLGAGALLDPVGANTYRASATTDGGDALTVAQGAGLFGLGLNVGNPSSTTYDAAATSNPHTVAETPDFSQDVVGLGQAPAQGFGLGALVDVAGHDEYRAASEGGSAVTGAQGEGFPAAALVDGQGQDTFEATAVVAPDLDIVYDLECPSGWKCFPTLDVDVVMGDAEATGQGHAFLGTGVLLDAGAGGATSTVEAASTPQAHGLVDCSGGGTCEGSADVEVIGGEAESLAQGSAGGSIGGSGILLGSAGSGAYSAVATTDAHASAEVATDDVGTCDATALAGDARILSQGSGDLGVGLLAEPGGQDGYSATQGTSASAVECGSSGSSSAGGLDWVGQGAASLAGAGVLVDVGGDDAYAASQGTSGGDDACWTNSPPGVPDPTVGVGVDASTAGPPSGCLPVPPN